MHMTIITYSIHLIATVQSINSANEYRQLYDHLEQKFGEQWVWDHNARTLAQGLYNVCTSFEHLVSFSVLFNGLERLKPLVVKVQKRNRDIFEAYHMIDRVLENMCDIKRDIESEFSEWYGLAVRISESVDAHVLQSALAASEGTCQVTIQSHTSEASRSLSWMISSMISARSLKIARIRKYLHYYLL